MAAEVTIDALPDHPHLILGHWGLHPSVSLCGQVTITPHRPRLSSEAPCSVSTRSVSLSAVGKIHTSNGDARKHSPYESFSFLKIGPVECLNAVAEGEDDRPSVSESGTITVPFKIALPPTLHASLTASDPEWGFGARIEYKLTASVVLVPGGNGISKTGGTSSRGWWGTTLTVDRPIVLVRQTPGCLLRAAGRPATATWSSETDDEPEPTEAVTRRGVIYEGSICPLAFGPGDPIRVSFKAHGVKGCRIVKVRVALVELQGVGVEAVNPSGGDDGVFRGLMEETTLGRKWLAEDVWWREVTDAEELDRGVEVDFGCPALQARLPRTTIWGPRWRGVNPSGSHANRVQIDHRVSITVEAVGPTGEPLPLLRLKPVEMTVLGFSRAEARRIVSTVPRLQRQVEGLEGGIPTGQPLRRLHAATEKDPVDLGKQPPPALASLRLASNQTLVEEDADN